MNSLDLYRVITLIIEITIFNCARINLTEIWTFYTNN